MRAVPNESSAPSSLSSLETSKHQPILVAPIVESLLAGVHDSLKISSPVQTQRQTVPPVIVDCTFGGGGHTRALLDAIQADPVLNQVRVQVLGIDRDLSAIEAGRARFSQELAEERLKLAHLPFSRVQSLCPQTGFSGVLADFGFSSDQIEDPARGLSFLREGPIDMRLDPSQSVTAATLLQQLDERALADLFWKYGEERNSRRIAGLIVKARREEGLPETTTGLAALISRAFPPKERHGRIHPATRTFQAIRIAVNQEMEEIDALLSTLPQILALGGRAAILTFHSLEDRRVKSAFRETPTLEALTRKPLIAEEQELSLNSRARSAKLRVARRINPA